MQNKRERIIDTDAEGKMAIRCKITGRLNARFDQLGMHVFCRQCNAQHLLSWADLEKIKQNAITGTGPRVIYI